MSWPWLPLGEMIPDLTPPTHYLQQNLSASLRSIPPLTLRNGHALDCIHPAGLRGIIGLSPKALLLIFSFLSTSLSEVGPPEPPFAFFGLAGAPLV
jgi:hypothetical protein